MFELIFATHNQHKIEEVRAILNDRIRLISLKELDFEEQIPETTATIEGNARMKASFIFDKFGIPCIADDTGLEIAYINNEPGVYSARYAGENANDEKNINKVLRKMTTATTRNALFRTVIAFHEIEKITCFQGIIEGTILQKPIGEYGFGYDPIFAPLGSQKSFAQMTAKEKNNISHRALAIQKFSHYVNNIY